MVVFVTVNNFYNGRIWKTKDGWRRDLESKTILQGDDVAVIIELIEQKLGVSFYWISFVPGHRQDNQELKLQVENLVTRYKQKVVDRY